MNKILPTIEQSPRDPSFYENPFPFYEKLREIGPLVNWKDYDMAVTGDYTLVNQILRDKRFGRQPPKGFFFNIPPRLLPFYENESRSLLELDPPTHTKLKSIALHGFTAKRLKLFEKEVYQLASYLLDNIKDRKFDLIKAFSEKFPVIIITRLLGVPENMASQLLTWSHDMVAMYQARRDSKIEVKAVQATLEFSKYLGELIIFKKKNLENDLISHLISAEIDGTKLNNDEIISTVILLLNAGHEATVHTISNAVKTILEEKIPLTEIQKNKTSLTEEILRYNTPLHMFSRYLKVDVEILNHKFNAGSKIGLLLAAANRDEQVFTEPNKFDPNRQEKSSLSLGAGIHFCLGAQLARIELKIAIPLIFKKFPNMELAKKIEYQDNYHFYGLKALPIELK